MQPIQLSGSNAIVSVSQGWYLPHLMSGGKCSAWIIGSASIHLGKIIIHCSVHCEHHKHEEKIAPTYNIPIRWTRKKLVEKKQGIAEEILSHPSRLLSLAILENRMRKNLYKFSVPLPLLFMILLPLPTHNVLRWIKKVINMELLEHTLLFVKQIMLLLLSESRINKNKIFYVYKKTLKMVVVLVLLSVCHRKNKTEILSQWQKLEDIEKVIFLNPSWFMLS